jgi:uncharacterized protein YkwD
MVLAETNTARARHGLRHLTIDIRLAAAAQGHCEDMVRRSFFAHDNPNGLRPHDRVAATGYQYRMVAENIAAGQRSAVAVVDSWMKSVGHRANILNDDLEHIGIGRAEGGKYGIYWVQVFGTPHEGRRSR